MIDRKSLNFWTDKDKRVEAAHILDLCDNALEHHEKVTTPFLSFGLSIWCINILKASYLNHLTWGGFSDAERVRYVLDSRGAVLINEDAQVTLIHALPRKKGITLRHRDILGSLLGLGLEREVIGDIRQSEQGVVIAVCSHIQDYILQNWTNVGKENIQVAVAGLGTSILPVAGQEKRVVTSSCRLDNVASTAFGSARGIMQELISHGLVKKNDIVTDKPDMEVRVNDIISCRGKGRFKISEEDARTRKGKHAWKIFIYKEL